MDHTHALLMRYIVKENACRAISSTKSVGVLKLYVQESLSKSVFSFRPLPHRDCAIAESSRAGQDDGTALKLWAVSCHLLGIRWR